MSGAAGRGSGRGDLGRRAAEWITLSVSALLILGVAGYLLDQTRRPETPYLLITAQPLFGEVQREGARYLLPVEVANRGNRAVHAVQIEARLQRPGGPPETRDWTIDLLGERARQRVYLYLSWPPEPGSVEVEPLLYRLE